MFTKNVTDKYMVNEQGHDSLSRVIGNSQARFLEGEDTATYSSLLDKKFGQYRSFYYPQFKESPLTPLGSGGTEGGICQIKLPKIGDVVINQHRPIPNGFKVKGVRVISRARNTLWYVVVTIQSNIDVPDVMPHGRAMGIDIGLENFLTTSDGVEIRPAHFFRDLQSQLKSLQRKVSRKQKRSKNYHKAQIKVARLHHKARNCRKNFHFQTAHQLCNQAQMIFVEDIDFTKTAKAMLGKHMLDGGFGQFRQLLKWVGWKRDVYVTEVDHRYTSHYPIQNNIYKQQQQQKYCTVFFSVYNI